MSRSKSVVKNLIWELGYYFIVILLGFLAPRYIILFYGSEVNGLSSTITQILNLIMLLQAGATTASVFSLYKPIADKDMVIVAAKIASAEKFFKKISFIFLFIMSAIAVGFSLYVKSDLRPFYIFAAFVILGFKSFLDLFFTSKFRIIFTAFQDKYVISIATLIEQVVYYILVFITLFLKIHFLFLYLWLFSGCVAKVLYLEYVYRKKFSALIPECNTDTKEVIPGRTYSLANEVSHSVVASSVAVIISLLYGLNEASVYSVYALVSSALYLFTSAISSAFEPSFGNLQAAGDRDASARVLSIYKFIFILFNTFLYLYMLLMILPFVKIYTKGVGDVNYINTLLAILLSLQCLLSMYRIPYNVTVSTCGFFKETWIQPVACAFIAILMEITFGKISYPFILAGPIFFYLCNFVYQHVKLKKLVPHLVSNNILGLMIMSGGGFVLSSFIIRVVHVPDGFIPFVLYGIICFIVLLPYLVIFSYFLDKEDFLLSFNYLKEFVKKYV